MYLIETGVMKKIVRIESGDYSSITELPNNINELPSIIYELKYYE